MRNKIIDIIAGKFILEKTNTKTVRFILFIFFLAIVMIYSSHSVDRKIYDINKLTNELNSVESSYLKTRKELMSSKMESTIRFKLSDKQIKPSLNPPTKILISDE
tara:strand:- start:1544 stop:1858 length:315 start_codon:yes stop_codon:yes gene_type:complete